ncbi:MAG: sigma 54-interacting transcriptional regulator [Verrucomicrobia bacterium]|nr:sigma 54-interacting transcriptional regulator [Verrucomicrobiota bacterium]
MIVSGLVERADIALARIWLIGSETPVADAENQERFLRLSASAGSSKEDGRTWNGLEGQFSRIRIGALKIGQIAQSREPLHLDEHEVMDSHWTAYLDWVAREGIKGFAGHPLIFRDEVLGVLAVFSRKRISPDQFRWLHLFADQAAVAIANARAFEEIENLRKRLELENECLRTEVKENFSGFIGESAALRKVLELIDLVARVDASVLIIGESGTGKELVARAIHERSKRRDRTCVKVNCASIPNELFESEFFGHVKGAFTGALRDRAGRFEVADGGTLFLDEVGEIPLRLQGKLLRVLQDGEFERVGEENTRRVDVRIISATNCSLSEELAAGRLRKDLYFRLSVFPLETPALRSRREDIPILAKHFLKRAATRSNLPAPRLTRKNVQELMNYSWPGNIRELQNVIERALILSRDGTLRFQLQEPAANLPTQIIPAAATQQQWLESQRPNIKAALEQSHGKIYGKGGAAELLGLRPTTLSSRIAALGMKRRAI